MLLSRIDEADPGDTFLTDIRPEPSGGTRARFTVHVQR